MSEVESNVQLCVNVDHIATLRQARGHDEPDPIKGAIICGLTRCVEKDIDLCAQALKYARQCLCQTGEYNCKGTYSQQIRPFT